MKSKLGDTRDTYKPFLYPEMYSFWLLHEQAHWLFGEVPMAEDVRDYKQKLTPTDREFLTKILRFFVQGDLDIASGYLDYYIPRFRQPEVRMMLSSFAAREAMHVAAYAHLIETLGLPESTYNEFLQFDEMKAKHDFYATLNKDNILDMIAAYSAFGEGVQLFGSFCALLNFQRNGLLKGLGQIISWSIVDETAHAEGMTKIFRRYVKENPEAWDDAQKRRIYTIAEDMVKLEEDFIDLIFNMTEPVGLTAIELKTYVRYLADRRLIGLGMKGIFKVKKNPLPWVEQMINAPSHANFFETKATDYGKGATTGSWADVWGAAGA
jgi:ribonucleoside-diphosphate reductase beta chain